MKVNITLQFDDHERKLIAWDLDHKGKATRELCRAWIESVVNSGIIAIVDRQADDKDGIRRYG